MPFTAAYRQIENCIVAVVQKFHFENQPLPTIWGTGFFVSEHGVVCTCKHVVDKCLALPKPSDYEGLPLAVYLFREVSINSQPEWVYFPLDVVEAKDATFVGEKPSYIKGDLPDVSFLLLSVRGTPTVTLSTEPVMIGETLGFAGFPMGTRALQGNIGFRQQSPSLHCGLASAVFPNRLAKTPYGFLLHANTQGGASGSPIFRQDGAVVGMLYMGLEEQYPHGDPEDPETPWYNVPTALTGCISGRLIAQSAALADAHAAALTGRPTLADLMAGAIHHHSVPGEGIMEPYKKS